MELRSGAVIGQNTALPADRRPAFEAGVRLVLARWTALCLAVENEWGGPNSKDKAQQLFEDIVAWFYRQRGAPDDGELEEELDEAISADFNVQAEDGSPQLVARHLVTLYEQLQRGDLSGLEAMRAQAAAQAAAGAAKSQREGGMMVEDDGSSSDDDDGDDGSSDDAMDEDGAGASAPQPQQQAREPVAPVVDEDGFTLVQGKGRGRRR